jgi:LuxR family maltose regulon positive regulatory protein
LRPLPVPIIRSKLYPPAIAADVVARKELPAFNPLNSGAATTLISAPAGYGKSTLARQWAKESDGATVWLSLDKSDSDLRQFTSYIVAGLSSIFPECCAHSAEALQSHNLPDMEELVGSFYNDVHALGPPVTLVLDDYHRINSSDVHAYMDALLKRPPQGLHVIIITRRDPPLSLHNLRASGSLREIRMLQLAFRGEETLQFIKSKYGADISDEAVAKLHERTEGWPAGLRLATLAAINSSSSEKFIASIPADPRSVRDYLMQEVLAHCPTAMRDYLLRSSILDRFSAPLCETICKYANDDTADVSGADFIKWLTESGLFSISLDDDNRWFRYHHLFQSLLITEATAELGEGAVRELHIAAAAWFEQHELYEEAISHLLEISDASAAAELIIRHRQAITNNEHWHRLNRWLMQLPHALLESRPELLLLRARWLRTAGSREESEVILGRAESLVESSELSDELRNELAGSLASSQSFLSWNQADGPQALVQAQRAMELLPLDSAAERGFAMIILGAAMQMMGDAPDARRILSASLSEAASNAKVHPTYRIRLFVSLLLLNWMDADLIGLRRAATEAIILGEATGLREALTLSRCMLAAEHYHRNEINLVRDTIRPALLAKLIDGAEFHVHCLALESLSQQLMGDDQAARDTAATLHRTALKSQSVFNIELAEAFRAELAVRQGRMAEALQWAQQYKGRPFAPTYAFYSPTMTLLKVLVLDDSVQSRERAAPLLDELVDFLRQIHQKRFLAETLALRAVFHDALGNIEAALDDLNAAIGIAQPGRFLRLFADLGPRLGKLLNRLDLNEEGLNYVGEILGAFENAHEAATAGGVIPARKSLAQSIDTLSRREEQVLGLLADRLSNKEIAERLHISTVTVKRHAANIFQKLGVHGRRQAVAKALGLGLISPQQMQAGGDALADQPLESGSLRND